MSHESICSGSLHNSVIIAPSRSNDPSNDFRFPSDFRSAGVHDRPLLRFGIDRILSNSSGTPEVKQRSDRKSASTSCKTSSFRLRVDLDHGRGSLLPQPPPPPPPRHTPLPRWCSPLTFPAISIIPWTATAAGASYAMYNPINSGQCMFKNGSGGKRRRNRNLRESKWDQRERGERAKWRADSNFARKNLPS